jgi:acyl-coenzyme A thioesterase PaaI-like protein
MRWLFNLFPAYRGTGGKVTYIAGDWREARMELPLSLRTRNYVGTIFGGSLYGSVDPFFMIMLLKILGPDFVVWDKAATIRFRRPGRERLYGTFLVTDDDIREILEALQTAPSVDRVFHVDLKSADGTVCAAVDKTIYVKRKVVSE